MKRNPGLIFGVAGIFLVFAAAIAWAMYARKPIELQATKIDSSFPSNWPAPGPTTNYFVWVPKEKIMLPLVYVRLIN